MSAILDFLRMWWSGKLPDNHHLLGIPVFSVARAGKVLQLSAGLVVVFDLLTARWLTDWANRASIRAGWRAILILHEARIKVIRQSLIHSKIPPSRHASAIHFMIKSPPSYVPSNLQLTLTAYRNFHRNVIENAKCENECKKRLPDARMCHCQHAYVIHRIEKLAKKLLSSEERAVVANYKSTRSARGFWIGYLATLVVISCCAGISYAMPPEWLRMSWLGLFVFFLGFVLPLLVLVFGSDWRGQLKWYRFNERLAALLLWQAKKSPPFRDVKVGALVLFLVGAVLDLVAS